MAALTATNTQFGGGQGVIRAYEFSSIDDGDTFAGPKSPKAFWASVNGNPGTQASAGAAVAESSGTYTFYPGTDSLAGTLFVLL